EADAVLHLRPSRYCEVDEFERIAAEVIGGREGTAALDAVVDWVHDHLDYVPGSSTVTDSARSTYVSRQGVCRDYAHLTARSEEHTSELQSRFDLVCRLLLEKKKTATKLGNN